MATYELRLIRDEFGPGAPVGIALAAVPRVVYVLRGSATVASDAGEATLGANSAWHGTGECAVTGGPDGATVLRYELWPPSQVGQADLRAPLVLAHEIALDPSRSYLMRCDRVDFDLGGVALPHGHRGGGIRCLIRGELEVRVGDHPPRRLRPGDNWFESGNEPVHAIASAQEPTSFIRPEARSASQHRPDQTALAPDQLHPRHRTPAFELDLL